jgi:membrane protease YdiL (CAAX protease family)
MSRMSGPRSLRSDGGGRTMAQSRKVLIAAVAVAGTGLLGASLSTEPDSNEFYALTFAVAGTWLVGGLASELPHLHADGSDDQTFCPTVLVPILAGAAAFGAFYGAALIARHIPILEEALTSVLTYAEQGSGPLVLATTLANGVAEEVFFRGAVFTAFGHHSPALATTTLYMLATGATRNWALVLAAGAMGSLFALQRRATGGIQAPILTHLTWSALMLRYLPSLFRKPNPSHG